MEKTPAKKLTESKISSKKTKPDLLNIESEEKSPLKKWWAVTSLGLVAALGLIGYLGYKNMVLAWVDNTPITKLDLYNTLEKRFGKDYTDRLVTETLILNEAKNRGVEISEDEINSEIKKFEDQEGGADKLDQALITQKMTREDLKAQLKFRKLIEKMFGKDVVISDKEISDFVEKNKAQYPEFENPKSSEAGKLKQEIADNLKNEQISKSFNEWLTEAQKSTRIKRL